MGLVMVLGQQCSYVLGVKMCSKFNAVPSLGLDVICAVLNLVSDIFGGSL